MTQTPSNLFEDDGNEIPAEGTLEVTGEEQTQDLLQSIDELDKGDSPLQDKLQRELDNIENILDGSVFDGNQLRLVNILGYEMDINPIGNLLFVKNEDIPGVIGKVGSLLGKNNINIGDPNIC